MDIRKINMLLLILSFAVFNCYSMKKGEFDKKKKELFLELNEGKFSSKIKKYKYKKIKSLGRIQQQMILAEIKDNIMVQCGQEPNSRGFYKGNVISLSAKKALKKLSILTPSKYSRLCKKVATFFVEQEMKRFIVFLKEKKKKESKIISFMKEEKHRKSWKYCSCDDKENKSRFVRYKSKYFDVFGEKREEAILLFKQDKLEKLEKLFKKERTDQLISHFDLGLKKDAIMYFSKNEKLLSSLEQEPEEKNIALFSKRMGPVSPIMIMLKQKRIIIKGLINEHRNDIIEFLKRF